MSLPVESGHFKEDLSASTVSSPPTPTSPTSPLPLAPVAVPAAPRGRNRAFSPVRVGSAAKGLFARKKKPTGGETDKVEEGKVEVEELAPSVPVEEDTGAPAAAVDALGLAVAEEDKNEVVELIAAEAEVVVVEVEAIKTVELKEDEPELTAPSADTSPLPTLPTLEALVSPALPLTPALLTTLPTLPTTFSPPTSPKPSLTTSASSSSSVATDFSAAVAEQIKQMLQHFPAGDKDKDEERELVPPPPTDHAHLLTLLARPEVMNGEDAQADEGEKKAKGTVWEALERGTHDSFCSIMVSCDLDFILNPTSTTPTVTLASFADLVEGGASEADVQRVHPHTHKHSHAVASGAAVNIGGWKVPLPTWPGWGIKKPEEKKKEEGENGKEGGEKKVVRVWYPSQTQMSLHAAWWGFSIYLPPPVMEALSDTQVGTLKRVSALATALGYLIKFLPALLDLGPGMLVALALLSSLVPMLGYLASFIAWSWSSIKSYDKGKGVILSATWLCPLLLITRSWDAPTPVKTAIEAGKVIAPKIEAPVVPNPVAAELVVAASSAAVVAEEVKAVVA